MPREAACKCGECRLCKQRECQRKARARFKDVIWPQDQWGMDAKAEAERLMAYSSPLADVESWRTRWEERKRAMLALSRGEENE